jgi:ornithine carbamoyltransferase
MGQEGEKSEREKAFAGYQIGVTLMKPRAPTRWCSIACPPTAGRRLPRMFRSPCAEIFDEAENRLHAQKAVLVKLMG